MDGTEMVSFWAQLLQLLPASRVPRVRTGRSRGPPPPRLPPSRTPTGWRIQSHIFL